MPSEYVKLNYVDWIKDMFDFYGWNLVFEVILTEGQIEIRPKLSFFHDNQEFFEISDINKYVYKIDIHDLDELMDSGEENQKKIVYQRTKMHADIFSQKKLVLLFDLYLKKSSKFVKSAKIQKFGAIQDLNFSGLDHSKEIYFLGENGDGKSLILMGIYLVFNAKLMIRLPLNEYSEKSFDLISVDKTMKLFGIDSDGLEYGSRCGTYMQNFFAYGVHRGRFSTDNPERYGFMSLFDSEQELNNPITWLTRLYAKELQKAYNENRKIEDGIDTIIPIGTIKEMFYELLERNVEIEVDVEHVLFKEKGYSLTFEQLSEGYKNLIIWVCDLIYRLHQNQPEAQKINELHGIVMVDEIELHLHPKWQRTLVGKLRKFFPNVQFIFTTHSPTIIQGASDEAIIYKVYRDAETGHTKVSEPYYKKDLDDMMLNSLVTSPLFGLEDARMTNKPVSPDTSETYTLSRINKRVEARLAEQRKNGKTYVSDAELDSLIDAVLDEETEGDDQNK